MEAIVQARAARDEFAETRDFLEQVSEILVESDEDQELAAEALRLVKFEHSVIEKKRTAITGPLNVALREVNDLFRPMKNALDGAERLLKGRIAAYLAEKDRRNRAALVEASEASTAEQAVVALKKVEAFAPPAGVSVRQVWKVEVVDDSLVPREYLAPDLPKILLAVQRSNGELQIPGVRVFQEPIVTSRKR